MRLLAFETATEACSVAVMIDGEVRERFGLAPRRHAELALPWAEALLAEAGIARSQLDAVAVGRGPGAFTGVRLGISIAQGIALALDRPVVPVSTLAVLAAQALLPQAGVHGPPALNEARASGSRTPRFALAAIDARMGEVYLGAFRREGDGMTAIGDEAVVRPDQAPRPDGTDWAGVGTGFAAANGALEKRLQACLVSFDAAVLPHAADLARLAAIAFARGQGVAPERVEPAYLRDNVALTLIEQAESRRRGRP